MSIHFKAPPDVVARTAARLGAHTAAEQFEVAGIEAVGGAQGPPAQPIFTAGLTALAESGGDLERAAEAPTSWRFSSEAGGAVEIPTAEGEGAEPTVLADDPFASEVAAALRHAERDWRVSSSEFDARLLRVPALKLLAIWLRGASSEDLFVPLAAPGTDATTGEIYAAGEFGARVAELASETLAHYAEAEDPDALGG